MNEAFQKWLESNDCYELLFLCSKQVISRARKKAINLEGIFQDALTDGLNDLSQVVAHEMWQFLKEKSGRLADVASDKLVHGDTSGFMEAVIGNFLDHCKDKRRTIAVDPVYAYYRSLRTALSKADEVNFQPTGRGAFFAFSFDESLRQLPYTYWDQPYNDWPQPPYSDQQIFKSTAIVELARFFWIEALDRFVDAYLLPVKEFSRFLNCKYQIGCEIENESNGYSSPIDDDATSRPFAEIAVTSGTDDYLGYNARQNPRIEMDIIETELDRLARDCLATLSETERIILNRTESGVTLADIAIELDMKHPSNVNYHQGKAYDKLKRIWSLWGPASAATFSEVDEEEFWIFYDKVIVFCKTADHCREI